MTRWRVLATVFLGAAAVATVVALVALVLRPARDTTGRGVPAGAAAAVGTASTPAGQTTPVAGTTPPPTTSTGPAGAANDPLCQARAASDKVYNDAWRKHGARGYRAVLQVALPARLAYYQRAADILSGAEHNAYVALVNYQRSEIFGYQRYGWDPKAPLRDPASWPRPPIQAYGVVNALMRTRCGIVATTEAGPTRWRLERTDSGG